MPLWNSVADAGYRLGIRGFDLVDSVAAIGGKGAATGLFEIQARRR